LDYSPDSKLLAISRSSSPNEKAIGHVTVREVGTGKELLDVALGKDIVNLGELAFSPDGKTLAAGLEKDVHLWSVPGGRLLHKLAGHGRPVRSLAFAQGGKRLVSGDAGGLLCLWDAATGERLLPETTAGHPQAITAAVFTPDGSALYTGDGGGEVRSWGPKGGRQRGEPWPHGVWITALAVSPDSRRVLTSFSHSDPCIRDTATGSILLTLRGHDEKHAVRTAVWSPHGKLVATGGDDQTIRLWDPASGREVRQLDPRGDGGSAICAVRDLAFSPDGDTLLATCENETRSLWRVADGRKLWSYYRDGVSPSSSALSPDGRWAAFWGDGQELELLETATGQPCANFSKGSPEPRLFLSDGQTVAACKGTDVILYDLAAGREKARLSGHRGTVRVLAYCPRRQWLASAGADTTAVVWDVAPFVGEALPVAPLSPEELQGSWRDLEGKDPEAAYRAIWALARGGDAATRFLKEHLQPVAAPDAETLRLVRDLDAEDFKVRERATAALARLKESAEPALRQALGEKSSAEPRNRIEELLKPLEPSRLRGLRAVQALELAATAQAKEVLEACAKGASAAALTQTAKGALDRLAARGADSARPGKRGE
jgi:WD40 repeat protein